MIHNAKELALLQKRGKYNAKKVVVNGLRFDSQKEYNRWRQLVLLEQAGEIQGLRRQVPYVLIEKSRHGRAIKYIADFCYMEGGKEVVEDAKGFKTDIYKLKKRLMAELYDIEIRET